MENQKESSDCEDIPSDFFDDFNKDEFIEGLSVIDSWNDGEKKLSARARINADVIDSVRDLRELIDRESHEKRFSDKYDNRKKLKRKKVSEEREHDTSYLDEYIKPGSRRDPNKTNEAIKRDKQEKVKEYLAKHLESSEDLRPPGTELDDFLEEKRIIEVKKTKLATNIEADSSPPKMHESVKRHRETPLGDSPGRHLESPEVHRKSPKHHRESSGKRRESSGRRRETTSGRRRESPGKRRVSPGRRRESPSRRRESPGRRRESPGRRRESPGRRRESPGRRRESPDRRPGRFRVSPPKYRHVAWRRPNISPRWSPGVDSHRFLRQNSPQRFFRRHQRLSPHRKSSELHRYRRSRSPYKRMERRSRSRSNHRSIRSDHRRSRSGSPRITSKDDFLYPKEYLLPSPNYSAKIEMLHQVASASPYAEPMPVEYGAPGYSYVPPTHGPAYSGYGVPYEYGPPAGIPVPQPVPAPIIATAPDIPLVPVPAPSMVPAPSETAPITNSIVNTPNVLALPQKVPADALAKLVADGKLSHEDYLKLTPNKGVSQCMDTHARIAVLNRCQSAISKLSSQALTNRLLINNQVIGPEQKQIVPKFCSPLKRQVASEFYFTKFNPSVIARQNKQIVDFIITALGIQDVAGRPKKKVQKDTKEVGVQTVKPYCEVCDIREATKTSEFGTMVERELLTSSVHTQVVEEELYRSKAVFTPSGGEGANVSIAHMTPAQLVSQLAARAKTLKQSEPLPPRYDPRYDPRQDYNYNYRY